MFYIAIIHAISFLMQYDILISSFKHIGIYNLYRNIIKVKVNCDSQGYSFIFFTQNPLNQPKLHRVELHTKDE